MLVYCSNFDLQHDVDLSQILGVVSSWLSVKCKQQISSDFLAQPGNVRTKTGVNLHVRTSNDQSPFLMSIQIVHADSEVNGRRWVTEFGLKRESLDKNFQASVLLETQEVSTRVTDIPIPSRPLIVQQLIDKYGHKALCPGISIGQINSDMAEDFQVFLTDNVRQHPVVLISPKSDGTYFVTPEDIRFQVAGLAHVYAIPPNSNSYRITSVLGKRYSAWQGAINIIFPLVPGYDDSQPFNHLLISQRIESILSEGKRLDTEILSLLCHRSNLPNSWLHTSPEKVESNNLTKRLENAREIARKSGETSEYINLLEEVNSKNDEQISELKVNLESVNSKKESLELELMERDDEIRQHKYEIDSLKASFSQIEGVSASSEKLGIDAINAIKESILNEPTPEQSLLIIELLFSDRVIILNSARKSALQSKGFRYGNKAFELLWLLCTEYWSVLNNGSGDSEAKKCFGNSFAAKESETVESNEKARARRTFEFQGQKITMMKHLKHGVKDSTTETIRIHFEWIPEMGRVVIGHCGPHLDFS